MLEIGAVLVRESRRFIVGMLASALAVSSVAAQE